MFCFVICNVKNIPRQFCALQLRAGGIGGRDAEDNHGRDIGGGATKPTQSARHHHPPPPQAPQSTVQPGGATQEFHLQPGAQPRAWQHDHPGQQHGRLGPSGEHGGDWRVSCPSSFPAARPAAASPPPAAAAASPFLGAGRGGQGGDGAGHGAGAAGRV